MVYLFLCFRTGVSTWYRKLCVESCAFMRGTGGNSDIHGPLRAGFFPCTSIISFDSWQPHRINYCPCVRDERKSRPTDDAFSSLKPSATSRQRQNFSPGLQGWTPVLSAKMQKGRPAGEVSEAGQQPVHPLSAWKAGLLWTQGPATPDTRQTLHKYLLSAWKSQVKVES